MSLKDIEREEGARERARWRVRGRILLYAVLVVIGLNLLYLTLRVNLRGGFPPPPPAKEAVP